MAFVSGSEGIVAAETVLSEVDGEAGRLTLRGHRLQDIAGQEILVVASGLHVSTGPAYAGLQRGLTFTGSSNKINDFQAFVRALSGWQYAPATRGSAKVVYHTVVLAHFP